jgi:hypothetical protein
MNTPASVSDAEILKSVVEASHLNTLALEANRNRELTSYQQAEFKEGERRLVILLLVCAAGILSAVLFPSAVTYALAIFGLIFGAFLGYAYFKWRRAPGRVGIIDGQLTREKKVNYTRYGVSVYYFYHVGEMRFYANKSGYDALSRDIPVRAYYLVGSGSLLNLDLLPPGTEKRDPERLPYTDF